MKYYKNGSFLQNSFFHIITMNFSNLLLMFAYCGRDQTVPFYYIFSSSSTVKLNLFLKKIWAMATLDTNSISQHFQQRGIAMC